jgi:hypothetical protein
MVWSKYESYDYIGIDYFFLTFVIIVIKIKMTTKIDNRKLMICCNYLNQSGSRYMD